MSSSNNSRWDSLTMAQRAELIGIAVRHGVTGLKEIRNMYEDGGEITYNVGMLPEVTIKPEPWQKDFHANFGNKKVRENIINTWEDDVYSGHSEVNASRFRKLNKIKESIKNAESNPGLASVVQPLKEEYQRAYKSLRRSDYDTINYDEITEYNVLRRLHNIWNAAGRPAISENYDPSLVYEDSNENKINRASIVMSPFGDEILGGDNLSDIVAELSHPLQLKYGKQKYNQKAKRRSRLDELHGDGYSRYQDPTHYEQETHSVVEPELWDYLIDEVPTKYVKGSLTDINLKKKFNNKYSNGGKLVNKFAEGGEKENPDLNKFLNKEHLSQIGLGWISKYLNNPITPSIKRVRENDSPTRERSEGLEDIVAKKHINAVAKAKKAGKNPNAYYIPYVDEIYVPGIGRLSSNTLDSTMVNAGRAGIEFSDGLGLVALETKGGASPTISTAGWKQSFKKQNNRNPTAEEIKDFERAMMNMSYARNYGGIHPQFLVNDHEYTNEGYKNTDIGKTLENIQSPLQHAFTMFKHGLYNPGDPNHTKKVKSLGKQLVNTEEVQNWLKQYNSKKKTK